MKAELGMKIIDLFCGTGGFAYGFIQSNPRNRVELGVDIDFHALSSYKLNITPNQIYNENIRKLHACEILDLLDGLIPDILISSPPCEPFSAANPKRQKTAYNQLYSDETGRLILDTIRIIIDLQPEVFIIENVPNLASTEMKQLILHEFLRSDYEHIYFNLLEAQNFGVPSLRKRVFISNVEMKSPTKLYSVSVNEAFQSLPPPCLEFSNHNNVPVSPKIAKKIHSTPPGGALVYFKGSHGGTFRNYIRLRANKIAPTIVGKSRFIHPSSHRYAL